MIFRTITLDCACWKDVSVRTVDRIARVQLDARRNGMRLRLENASRWLLDLIDFCGLAEVLGVQSGRQVEERKKPRRVEEERELGDSALR